jgi:hypothetical protein
VRSEEPESFSLPISDEMIEQLKFSSCLLHELALAMLEARLMDRRALGTCLRLVFCT